MAFNPQSTVVATGSMDTTVKLWSIKSGGEEHTLAVSACNNHGCHGIMFTMLKLYIKQTLGHPQLFVVMIWIF